MFRGDLRYPQAFMSDLMDASSKYLPFQVLLCSELSFIHSSEGNKIQTFTEGQWAHGASLLLFCCPFSYHTVSEVGLIQPCTKEGTYWTVGVYTMLKPRGISVLYSVTPEVAFSIPVGKAKVCDAEQPQCN